MELATAGAHTIALWHHVWEIQRLILYICTTVTANWPTATAVVMVTMIIMITPTVEFCPGLYTAVLPFARWPLSIQLFMPLCCPLHADCCLPSCSYRCAALCTLTVVCPHIMQVSSTTNPFCRSYGSVVAKPGTCEGSVLCQEQGLVNIPTLTLTLNRYCTVVCYLILIHWRFVILLLSLFFCFQWLDTTACGAGYVSVHL